MEDETLLNTMLFDFFGELLTEKQREYYDLYHNDDLSLSEISERTGISRQGVHDIISRADKSLSEIEQKTGVVSKWLATRAELEAAESIAHNLHELCVGNEEIAELSKELIGILHSLARKV
jgi:predicted DNA-binding protein YlxM (UPF0122 family)